MMTYPYGTAERPLFNRAKTLPGPNNSRTRGAVFIHLNNVLVRHRFSWLRNRAFTQCFQFLIDVQQTRQHRGIALFYES